MTRFSIAFAIGVAGSCAPSTHATAWRDLAPKGSADEVQVFTGSSPEQAYEEIGTIEVAAAELSDTRYGELIELARVRAAAMGADAIIVTRDPQSRSMGAGYLSPEKKNRGQLLAGTSRTIETPRILVAAIVWRIS